MVIAIDASSNEATSVEHDSNAEVQRTTNFRRPKKGAEDKIIKRYNEEEDERTKYSDDNVSVVNACDGFLHLRFPAGQFRNQRNVHDVIKMQRSEWAKGHLYQSALNTFERMSTTYSGVFMPRPNCAIERIKPSPEKGYNLGTLRREQAREQEKIEFWNARVGVKLSTEEKVSSTTSSGSDPEISRRENEPFPILPTSAFNSVSRCGHAGPKLRGKRSITKMQPVSYEICFDGEEPLQKQKGVLFKYPAKEHIGLNWSCNTSEYTNNLHEVENHYFEQSQERRQSILSSIWTFNRLHVGLNKRNGSVNSDYHTIAAQSQARSPPCTELATPPCIPGEEGTLNRNSSETSVIHVMRIPYYDDVSEKTLINETKDHLQYFLSIKNSVPCWNAHNKFKKGRRKNEATIIVSMGKTRTCQNYLVELCKALMLYGAPTHRLEGCLITSSRVLGLQAQFLYIPGFMIICFEDLSTRTTNVQLVCIKHEIHLRKLCDVHEVYKNVIHCRISVEDATSELVRVKMQKPRYPKWVLLFAHGFASASVGPFAFKAQFSDLPICLLLGLILGFSQLYILPLSEPFARILEVAVAGVTSFLARYIGSLQGGDRFCFSAMAQSSIALILPGYMVVCGSLELQSRFIVAGSVRIIYAIIYSMFLGYGITIGTVTYGAFEKDATSEISCRNPISGFVAFLFVPIFTVCLVLINHGEISQIPIMTTISIAGYVVNYFTHRKFNKDFQLNSTFGALTIGLAANLYSRLGNSIDEKSKNIWAMKSRFFSKTNKNTPFDNFIHQSDEHISSGEPKKPTYRLAAVVMLPAIFVQMPSGLSATGSLLSGLGAANEIIYNSANTTTGSAGDVNSVAIDFTLGVIRVAIGITVGLGLSELLVYPLGKKKSGLFSF